jgi:hypothetical protein
MSIPNENKNDETETDALRAKSEAGQGNEATDAADDTLSQPGSSATGAGTSMGTMGSTSVTPEEDLHDGSEK